jgi:Domain of unknown function (DUF4292)
MKNNSMNKLALLLVLLLGLGVSACKTSKKTAGKEPLSAANPTEALLRKMDARKVNAKWMDAKAKIDFRSPEMSVSGTVNIRMQMDSAIWVSVRKLGFEVGRALVKRDSVYVIDRINNEYTTYGLDYLSKEYQVPANLLMIQQILLGNPFFLSRSVSSSRDETQFTLLDQGAVQKLKLKVDAATYRLTQMDFSEPSAERSMILDLGEYNASSDKQDFSYLRTFNVSSKETGKVLINLQFTQVELNVPTAMPFEAPARFTRK